jgi:hypothetical protein
VLAGLPPSRAGGDPVARGAYRYVRHPIYLGWVLLVWAASDMTMGRFAFAAISTAYLVIAVPFEERSLRRRFGPAMTTTGARSAGGFSRGSIDGGARFRSSTPNLQLPTPK